MSETSGELKVTAATVFQQHKYQHVKRGKKKRAMDVKINK